MKHVDDSLDLLLKRFDSSWGQPMSKKVRFLDSPLAFERVNGKAFWLWLLTHLIKNTHVFIKVITECSNVVDANFEVVADVS